VFARHRTQPLQRDLQIVHMTGSTAVVWPPKKYFSSNFLLPSSVHQRQLRLQNECYASTRKPAVAQGWVPATSDDRTRSYSNRTRNNNAGKYLRNRKHAKETTPQQKSSTPQQLFYLGAVCATRFWAPRHTSLSCP